MQKIILASASPRRKVLLEQLGLNFEVFPSDINEDFLIDKEPISLVEELSLKKAMQVSMKVQTGLILAADTIVVHRGTILGKPKNEVDARIILKRLSNDVHQVITGLALINASSKEIILTHAITQVFFKKLQKKMIEGYIATGEPMDKAGAYGIQGLGACFVDKIDGCYFNVVGLPISKLVDLLAYFDVDIF